MRLTAIVALLVACLAVSAFAAPRQVETFDESNDVECQLCEWVINELKSVVVQNDTEAIILNSLEQACKYLPNQDLANEVRLLFLSVICRVTDVFRFHHLV